MKISKKLLCVMGILFLFVGTIAVPASAHDPVVVNILVPCDEEYRAAKGSNWESIAENRILDASYLLWDKFHIIVYADAIEWTSDHSSGTLDDAIDLWDEARADNYNAMNGYDLMTALSGQNAPILGYAGTPGGNSSINFGPWYENRTIQHEWGHNYTVYHHSTPACIMNNPCGSSQLCDSCKNQWDLNRTRY